MVCSGALSFVTDHIWTREEPTMSQPYPIWSPTQMATVESTQRQRDFTRELIAMGGAGLLSGVATAGLGLIAGGHFAALGAMSFGAFMALGASLIERQDATAGVRLSAGIVGGIAMALLLSVSPMLAAAVGGLGLAVAFVLEYGERPAQRALVGGAFVVMMMAAWYTSNTLMTVGPLQGAEGSLLGELVRAAIWTLFMGLATGLKALEWQGDPVLAEMRETRALITHGSRELLDNAISAYERVSSEIGRESQPDVKRRGEEIAQELGRAVIALTRRSHEIHESLRQLEDRPLDRRARELEDRARATKDVALKRELMAALSEILEQMRTRSRLEAAGVRLEARAQRYLTALERLHVTLIQNDSLTADDGAVHIALDDLSRLSEEVHWKNLTLDELVGDTSEESEEEEASQSEDLEALLGQIESLTGSMRAPQAAPVTAAPAPARAEVPLRPADAETILGTSADEPVIFAPSAPEGADGTDGHVDEEAREEAQHVQRNQR
jgi:hypothetical protein